MSQYYTRTAINIMLTQQYRNPSKHHQGHIMISIYAQAWTSRCRRRHRRVRTPSVAAARACDFDSGRCVWLCDFCRPADADGRDTSQTQPQTMLLRIESYIVLYTDIGDMRVSSIWRILSLTLSCQLSVGHTVYSTFIHIRMRVRACAWVCYI